MLLVLFLVNTKSRATAIQQLENNFKSIDILINNARIGPDIDHCTPSEVDAENTLSLNLSGTVLFSEQLIGHITLKGKIINISSKMGSINSCKKSDSRAYKISKTELNMYTQILCVRVKKGLVVAAIHPGWVKTFFEPSNIYDRLTTIESGKETFIMSLISPEYLDQYRI